MKLDAHGLRVSATDVSDFTACRHLTRLELAAAHGLVERPIRRGLEVEAIAERGLAHEAAVLDDFRADGWSVHTVSDGQGEIERADQTTDLLRQGVDVVYQGVLLVDNELGRPDFLVRSPLLGGGDGYEVVDAKLARSAKALAVVQASFYSRLVAQLTTVAPERLHLALGNRTLATFRVAGVAAYERQATRMFRGFVDIPIDDPSGDTYPDPVEHCSVCRWSQICGARRRADDDLSLIAGITARQRIALSRHGIGTRRALAACESLPRLDDVNEASLHRVYAQARIQVAGEDAGRPLWELLDPERDQAGVLVPNRGLLSLPEPSDGDLFFDIEGARHWTDDSREFGLQYLFGIVDTAQLDSSGRPTYVAWWARSRDEEKQAFQAVVDFITARIETHPQAHVYHYNHYEPTHMEALSELHVTRTEALGQLMGRYATREAEVDQMLRRQVFVDLFRVVRQSLRASVESYSIKRLEPLIGYDRAIPLEELNPEMIRLESDLDRGTADTESSRALTVRGYNEDDCRSTLALRDWLETRRQDLSALLGEDLPRPEPRESRRELVDPEVERLRLALLTAVGEDVSARSDAEHARVLLADLLDFHRRNDKPMWWNYFRLKELEDTEQLVERQAIGGLQFVAQGEVVKRSRVFMYEMPPQEHDFDEGDTVEDPLNGERYKIHVLDESEGRLGLLRSEARFDLPHPRGVIAAAADISHEHHKAALLEIAEHVLAYGETDWPRTATHDLLLRRTPNLGPDVQMADIQSDLDGASRAVTAVSVLTDSYLPIQGPPGTGKTYAAVQQILHLVAAGKRVGVTAPSHAVISHLLDEIAADAARHDHTIRIGQRVDADSRWRCEAATRLSNTQAVVTAFRDSTLDVVGGTSWVWTHPDLRAAVDVLVVDEAGQLSIADALAVSLSANSLVLLGDPMQLSQPSQGSHPPGADISALEHVLGDRLTMPEGLGLFMESTRRMHPTIREYISEMFYEGRLVGIDGLESQRVTGDGLFAGSGIRVLDVVHQGNDNSSREEADVVAEAIRDLLNRGWIDREGVERPLSPRDLLVVTPFNAQIRELVHRLREAGLDGVPVGTVDKFQGRQAPVVLYSMASSSAGDAPRGMEFLYDFHRCNVAISRAQCMAILVSSPELARVMCHTPRQIELANALCRLREVGVSA